MFLVTAEGKYRENPRHPRPQRPRAPAPPRTAQTRLQTAQRGVSRRKKGRKRWWKAVGLCAKKDQKVKRQRGAFPHQTALPLVREDAVSSLEDLPRRHLSRRPQATLDGKGGSLHKGAAHKAGLHPSRHDAGW